MGGFQYTGLLIGLFIGVLFTFTSGAVNATLGSKCTVTGNCSTIPNSMCNQTCQCSADYFAPSSNKTTCWAKLAINAICHTQDQHQCKDINAECKNSNGNKCLCKDAYFFKTTCRPRITVNGTCVPAEKSCLQNGVCEKNKKCQCKVGYTYKKNSCSDVSKITIEISTIILTILALRCSKWFVE